MTTPGAVASILERLSQIPDSADVSLVIRHAERDEIPADTFGFDVSLTAGGIAAARRLGASLSAMRTVMVVSSPVARCVQTAKEMLRGGGVSTKVPVDRRLGAPGPFVVEPEVSGSLFRELPVQEIARRQLQHAGLLPGMRPTAEGVEILTGLTAGSLGENGRLDVYVTHDVILSVLVADVFRLPLEETGWPGYLEGLLVWRSASNLHFSWRGIKLVA